MRALAGRPSVRKRDMRILGAVMETHPSVGRHPGAVNGLPAFYFTPQQLARDLGAGLAGRGFHRLADEEPEARRLAGPVLGDGFRLRGDDVTDDRDERILIADLREPLAADDLVGGSSRAVHLLEDRLRGRAVDGAAIHESHQAAERLRRDAGLLDLHAALVQRATELTHDPVLGRFRVAPAPR